jgi:hypothetical protein
VSGVYEGDMSDSLADDAATEQLLRGAGREHDPALADFLALVRSIHVAEAPRRTFDFDSFVEAPASTGTRRRARRSVFVVRLAAALAAGFAATGTLAMAHALPGPAQDLAAHLGLGRPAVDRPHETPRTPPTPATDPATGIVVPGGSPKTPSAQTTVSAGAGGSAVVDPKPSPPTVRPTATTSTTLDAAQPSVPPGSTSVVGDTPTTAVFGNGSANGAAHGNANGSANGNGKANGNGNGNANGNANGNGKANSAGNGNANGAGNGNANGAGNGAAKGGKAKGH